MSKLMASEIPQVKPVHFILTQIFHQQKHMIPTKFVEKYGKSLPKDIYLKTPNGQKWKLNLVKSDGKIWFDKGWKEFAEYHSLSYYHLLVFKYLGTSHFEVQIFDKSALEINYPLKNIETENVSSFEFGSSSCVKVEKSQNLDVNYHIEKKHKGKQVTTAAEKNTILERAKSFKTCNPSFVVVMAASYVVRRFLLNIPAMFGKRHFDLDKKKGCLYFQVPNNERVWPARYLIRMVCGRLKFELTGGWKKFSKDNNLKVGDVCNFELILNTDMTFLVRIFREVDRDNADCSTTVESSQMKGDTA